MYIAVIVLDAIQSRTGRPRPYGLDDLHTTIAILMGTAGLEPATVRLEGGCSIQLSYVPVKPLLLYLKLFK